MKDIQEKQWFKISKIVLNVIFYTLIVVLVLFSIANINKKDEYSVPSLFGKGFTTVVTPSMDGSQKDSFNEDDLIFLSVVTEKNVDKKLKKVEVGSIIFEKIREFFTDIPDDVKQIIPTVITGDYIQTQNFLVDSAKITGNLDVRQMQIREYVRTNTIKYHVYAHINTIEEIVNHIESIYIKEID